MDLFIRLSNFLMLMVPTQERLEVIIEKVVRNKRKCITIVKGLELFGELFAFSR